jgi:hypothetical protein
MNTSPPKLAGFHHCFLPPLKKMISFSGSHFVVNFLQRIGKESLILGIPSIIGKTASAEHKESFAECLEET